MHTIYVFQIVRNKILQNLTTIEGSYTVGVLLHPLKGASYVKKCGVDTHGERGARAYNVSLGPGGRAPSRVWAEPLVRGAKLAANLPDSPYFTNSLNTRYL